MATEVVAEIGKNWITKPDITQEEALENAKLLALQAKESMADTVKTQCHVLGDEQNKRSESRHDWIRQNEFLTPFEFYKELKDYVESLGLKFLVTPFSKLAAMKIDSLVDRWKIASCDLTDLELLRYLAETKKPIILSTGMSEMPEIMRALDIVTSHGSKITLMHCISMYPTLERKLNLNTINYFKKGFPNFRIGFSDHSQSLFAPSLAVAMGCEVIEKHLTLDKNAYGPDHLTSLIPREFKKMVQEIRRTEHIIGTEDKVLYEEEKLLWERFRT